MTFHRLDWICILPSDRSLKKSQIYRMANLKYLLCSRWFNNCYVGYFDFRNVVHVLCDFLSSARIVIEMKLLLHGPLELVGNSWMLQSECPGPRPSASHRLCWPMLLLPGFWWKTSEQKCHFVNAFTHAKEEIFLSDRILFSGQLYRFI